MPVVADDVLTSLLGARSGKSLEDRRDVTLLRFFFDTGCRLSEVTNLRQEDIDLNAQTALVRGKGGKDRIVPYGGKTTSALDRYLRQLEKERPEALGADKFLWMGRVGRMSTSGVSDVLHRMCDDAGVPRLHWHEMRHTFAHNWLAEGGTEGDLMALAGWSDRSQLDRYGKSAADERARASARRMSLEDRI